MDSQDSSIEEKLVPFVEGALAEADRREVLQALPNQPALNQEVRHLREAIMALRGQAARGLSYQSPVEAPPEQVVDYALQGDQWSRQSSRQFQLHLLESAALSQELDILRELEQDLQQRVEPSKAVPEMPAALRQAIQDTYGKPPADPAWKRAAAAIVAWTAGLNLKVASAAVAGCVLVAGAVTVARLNHQSRGAAGNTVAVATTAPVAATPSPVVAAASPEPTLGGQVALLQEKVLPGDLPGLSRRLYDKHVTHSYRDGQIYVAQADFDRAWAALQLNNEKATGSKPLKTGGVAIHDKPTNLLDGVIGQLPAAADRKEEVKVKQPVPPTAAPASAASGGKAPPAQTGTMVGGVPDSKTAVAVELPAQPEVSQGNYAPPPPPPAYDSPPAPAPRPTYPAQSERARQVDPVVPRQTAPVPVPVRQPHTAAGAAHTTSAPSRTAHNVSDSLGGERDAGAVAPAKGPAASPTKIGRVFQPARKQSAVAKAKPADQLATNYQTEPQLEPPAPPIEALPRPAAPPRPISPPEPQVSKPKAPPVSPPPSPVAQTNANMEPIQEEAPLPVPESVLQEKKENNRDKTDAEDSRVNPGLGQTRFDDSARANKPVGYSANAGSSRASMSAQAGRSGMARDEGFQVKAGAPFEVAMLPVAKKLVEDLVGEAKVQMERKEDGHLLVTIRPARGLSPQEVDKLRKVVREKLELKEEDTVVIRQP